MATEAASKKISFNKIQRVILYVEDAERAAKWYNEVLGIPIAFSEKSWAELGTDGITLSLHGGDATQGPRETAAVGFHVADFDEAHKLLQERDVPALGKVFSPCDDVRCVSFKDPYGNCLGIEGK